MKNLPTWIRLRLKGKHWRYRSLGQGIHVYEEYHLKEGWVRYPKTKRDHRSVKL